MFAAVGVVCEPAAASHKYVYDPEPPDTFTVTEPSGVVEQVGATLVKLNVNDGQGTPAFANAPVVIIRRKRSSFFIMC